MPCSSDEPGASQGSGGHREPQVLLGQNPASQVSCSALLLAGTERCRGVWVCCPKCIIICFSPGYFWLLPSLLPVAAVWCREAPAGLPICELSLGRLLLSSSLSFCGVSHCLHYHTLVRWGDVSLGRHQTKITRVLRLGHQPAP